MAIGCSGPGIVVKAHLERVDFVGMLDCCWSVENYSAVGRTGLGTVGFGMVLRNLAVVVGGQQNLAVVVEVQQNLAVFEAPRNLAVFVGSQQNSAVVVVLRSLVVVGVPRNSAVVVLGIDFVDLRMTVAVLVGTMGVERLVFGVAVGIDFVVGIRLKALVAEGVGSHVVKEDFVDY